MPEAFGRNVIHFLTKPTTQFHIDAALSTAVRLLPQDIPIQLDGREPPRISSADIAYIAYITVDKVYTDLRLATGETVCNQRMSLTAWEDLLGGHQKYCRIKKVIGFWSFEPSDYST